MLEVLDGLLAILQDELVEAILVPALVHLKGRIAGRLRVNGQQVAEVRELRRLDACRRSGGSEESERNEGTSHRLGLC